VAKPARMECPAKTPSRPATACSAFDHVGDHPVTEPGGAQPTVAVDGPEGWASVDPGGSEPGPPCPYRAGGRVRAVRQPDRRGLALLVGLGATEEDPQAVVVLGHVIDVDGHRLASAQSAGEPDQQHRAVADVGGGGPQGERPSS
jgi:hypothetical protein